MHTLISSGHGKTLVVVQCIPVMLRWMPGVTAPFQVAASRVIFDEVLHHAPRKQCMYLALEERQVDVERSLRSERVVENGLLISLAPAMRPVVVDSFHVHPALV